MTVLPPAAVWRPLVSGARRELALSAIGRIAEQLRPKLDAPIGASLGRGMAGLALTYAYLAEVVPGAGYEEIADEQLSRAIDALANSEMSAELYGGFSGAAFVYDLVADVLHGEPPDLDALAEIDEGIQQQLAAVPTAASHELINGVAGFTVYSLGRGDQPLPRATLEQVLRFLELRAEITAAGVSWVTTPFMQRNWAGGAQATHSYNLGLSHGVPGTIGALAGMVAAGFELERTRPLLVSSTRWLVTQIRADGVSGLGYSAGDDAAARVAWCYGDLGVAVMLAWVARVLDDPSVLEAARALGMRAAERGIDETGVVDAGLCHGAAGNLHCFNRLWQHTGEIGFVQAAERWLDRTLAFGGPEVDATKLITAHPRSEHTLTDFLEGPPGVMCALAASISEVDPRWDRALLLSLPRANRGGAS